MDLYELKKQRGIGLMPNSQKIRFMTSIKNGVLWGASAFALMAGLEGCLPPPAPPAPPTPSEKGAAFDPNCPSGFTYSGQHCLPPQEGLPFGTTFGIMYSTWHCSFGGGSANPPDVSKVLKGEQSWGAYGSVYWKSQPLDGYYCLSKRDDVLRKHAIQLRDAGVSFVFVDASNHPSANGHYADRPSQMILEPLAAMLRVWSTIPGAPRIVPFAPVTAAPSPMVEAMMAKIAQYPKMYLMRDRKPFFLLTTNPSLPVAQSVLSSLAGQYSYRGMWTPATGDWWAGESWCPDLAGFKASGGTAACNQHITQQNGPEHIAVSPAFNSFIFSLPSQATPRFGGKTFARAFDTIYNTPTVRYATFADWNSWNAIHFCIRENGQLSRNAAECIPNTHHFVDTYTDELSRDIEPTKSQGDFYYRLMKACIANFQVGKKCDETSAQAVGSMGFGSSRADAAQRACTYPGETNIPSRKTGEVNGYVDRLQVVNGRFLLKGWACVVGSNNPINLHLYVGGPSGGGGVFQAGFKTNLPAEKGVHDACGNASSAQNRFSIDVTDLMSAHSGQRIYVHGINPNNGKNYYIQNSGKCSVPWAERL